MSLTGTLQRTGSVDIAPEGSPRSGFRGDIEGLRAIAVGVVVLYHAGVTALGGGFIGVDVFFVISGFLITTLLVEEMRKTGTVSLVGFYARRAKRLLPAALGVILATAVLSYLVLPRTRWGDVADSLMGSSVYVANWQLASDSVDYLQQGDAEGPLQHFWSLAVEEQFYLFWPVLLLIVTLWARRRSDGFLGGRSLRTGGRDLRWPLVIGLGLVIVPSLAWSILETASNPGPAYFITTTRVWELAIGGAVAIFASELHRLPRIGAALLAWAGLGAIVAAAFLYTESTPFPSYTALLPVLGTAAVIAAGPAAGRAGPVTLLGFKPMLWIGAISYSLYLWHWPLLVVATSHFDGDLTLTEGLAVAGLSLIPAWLSYLLIENPARRSQRLKDEPSVALIVGAVCSTIGLLAGLILYSSSLQLPNTATNSPIIGGQVAGGEDHAAFGAEVLGPNPRNAPAGQPVDKVDSISPDPTLAEEDFPTASDCAYSDLDVSKVSSCTFGSTEAGAQNVLLLGDSHAQQWIPALRAIGVEKNWKITAHLKLSCPFISGTVGSGDVPYDSCTEWNTALRAELASEPDPDLVIVTSVRRYVMQDGEAVTGQAGIAAAAGALSSAWSTFTDRGVPVAVILDSPDPDRNVPDCVAQHTEQLTKCTTPREDAIGLSMAPVQRLAADDLPGITVVDMTDAICPADRCAAVIGGTLIWKDTDHLTSTYVMSMVPRLEPQVEKALSRRGGA